jgi:two-component system NarL family response regulator
MLTGVRDDETVLESIQAGADGYLTKDGAVRDVVDAVRQAHDGETLLPESVVVEIARRVTMAQGRPDERQAPEALTARQREVLGALAEGLSSPQICERLAISRNTLRTHVQEMMARLHAHSKLEAVTIGLRYHLIAAPGAPPA